MTSQTNPMTTADAPLLAAELHLYACHLRTWTCGDEEIGNVRPLRELLTDAATALAPNGYQPKGDADAFMRRVGDKYPWLHPDYDPDDGIWQMRAVKARRRIRARERTEATQ